MATARGDLDEQGKVKFVNENNKDNQINDFNEEKRKKNIYLTKKYNMKLMRRWREVEAWIEETLRELYECEEDEEPEVEINVDEILDVPGEKRYAYLNGMLNGAKDSTDEFIKELMEKVKVLEALDK